jgi:hypothetical protein
VQDETCDKTGQSSRILTELQQLDSGIGPSGIEETVKSALTKTKSKIKPKARSKSPEKVAPVKSKPAKAPKAPPKKKTAATKKAEEVEQQRDFEATQRRMELVTQKVQADKAAEKKAAKEAREKARREKEEKKKRLKEPSPVIEYVTAPPSDDSDDEEPLMVKRRKAKPADWNFRIGAVDLTDDDEGSDREEVNSNLGDSLYRCSPDLDMDGCEEMSSLQPSRGKHGAERSISKERNIVTIDLSSDEETTPVQDHDDDKYDGAEMDVSFFQDDFASELNMDDSFFADQDNEVPQDWHQEYEEQHHFQEELGPYIADEDTIMAIEEPNAQPTLQIEGARLSLKAKTPFRSEDDEEPLFQAPPSSLSALADVPFKKDRLVPIEKEPEDFDPEYLEALLNEYD